MKELLFGEGFTEIVPSGQKKITLRRFRPDAHTFVEGEEVVGVFKEGPRMILRITNDTEVKTFADVTDEEAQEDGFADSEDTLVQMKHWYSDLTAEDPCAVIRFEFVRHI